MKPIHFWPYLLLLFSCINSHAFGQKTVKSSENIIKYPTRWTFSYLGEMGTHPGIKVGIERPLTGFTTVKTKYKKSGKSKEKARTRVFFLTLNGGSYIHRNNHIGLLVNGEFGYRKIRSQGLKSEALLGIGYIHNFWQGTTFQVQTDGSVTTQNITSQGGFSTHFSLGFGRDVMFIKNKKWAWHFRPTVLWQLPYSTGIVTRFFMELGITYQFKKK